MIDTSRLRISAMLLDDLEESRLLHNSPETLKWLSDTRVISSDEQLVWFSNLSRSSTSRRFVARAKSDSNLVGVFRFDNYDPINMSADVGLDIAPNLRRNGFAREIYLVMIPYFFQELSLNRLALLTLESNLAAISLYEGLGFRQEGILRQAFYRNGEFINALQYSLLRSEFKY